MLDLSDTGVVRYRSTRRYYRTDQVHDLSDTGVPIGTTELIQVLNLSDTGVPVGTTGLIQIRELSDTGVPVGTTEQIRYKTYQMQEYS